MAVDVETKAGQARSRQLHLEAVPVEPEAGDPMAGAGLNLMAPRPLVRQLVEGGAGQGVGAVKQVLPAAALIERLKAEYEAARARVAAL